jgi:flagellar motor switch protein FliN/FliY
MNALEDLQLEAGPAIAAASVLEQALAGASVFSVGQSQHSEDVAALVPAETAAVLTVTLPTDEPTRLGIAVSASLLAALEQTLGSAVAATAAVGEALLAAVGQTGLAPEGLAPEPGEAATLAGEPGNPLTAVAILEGSERLATVVLRVGPDLPDPSPEDLAADGAAIPHEFAPLDSNTEPPAALANGLDLIQDVEMQVTAVLGRAELSVRELLSLRAGAVVELDQAAGSPVDVLVNGTRIARGEVVVIDEEFGIRISEIVTGNGIHR